MTPLCPTCGGAVEVFTADEGTSSYRPVDASPARPHLIPDAAVEAMLVARYGYAEEWPGRRASVRVGLAAALPHLISDEMVERAGRAVHEVSDDVLPFDLPIPKGMGRIHERGRRQFIDQRRERYLTAARAALEAALGGAA